ncbi:hypothetical protein TEA_016250 [Camellia sinensis var. sinensis]|uniref:OCRE domain-containing protein n=1 Tax=Camellia sinensis var. sinensis TaxID=542762 RepID=A0A4S4ERX6_CAMSN|nr:hypothetical protein TEA_016250 [Camellia sinensis var. sinensis]
MKFRVKYDLLATDVDALLVKASCIYQKDISAFREARDSNAHALVAQEDGQGSAISGEEWVYDSSSGYYCNQNNGCFYDPNSLFYYTDALGRWVTRENAFAASRASSNLASKKPILKKPLSALEGRSALENKGAAKSQNGALPGPVVSAPLNPKRSIKGAPSSLTVNKRKRQDEKPKVLPEEEVVALKKKEAARKRVEEREKSLLGLYRQ